MDKINPIFKAGDHLVARRIGYTHHALYLGDGNVLEYLQEHGVTITSFSEFAKGQDVFIREHNHAMHCGYEAVKRGLSRLGESSYNLITNNCEHFVNWCIDGVAISRQVGNLVLTFVPFYAIFKATDFCRGCLKFVVNEPQSVNDFWERIDPSKAATSDPWQRAEEICKDVFSTDNYALTCCISVFTLTSQVVDGVISFVTSPITSLKDLDNYVTDDTIILDVNQCNSPHVSDATSSSACSCAAASPSNSASAAISSTAEAFLHASTLASDALNEAAHAASDAISHAADSVSHFVDEFFHHKPS